jgi:glycosyltransferase involved in cell wall biosynthesis
VLKPKERNDLVIGAEALLLPTLYREPFGGAAVEAQMLGTPAITTDHAAFAETIWHGVTGYRCGTLRCFVEAAKQAHLLDRDVIASRAKKVHNCDVVQYQYEDYFQDVLNLWDARGG